MIAIRQVLALIGEGHRGPPSHSDERAPSRRGHRPDRQRGGLVFADSPTLIGTPMAPTAAPGTNTTQLATTAYADGTLSNSYTVTLGGNRTLGAPSGLIAGQFIQFSFKQDGTGSRTLAYNAVFKFAGGLRRCSPLRRGPRMT